MPHLKLPSRHWIMALAILLGLAVPLAGAQERTRLSPVLQSMLRADNPVVGRVGRTEIRWNEVIRSASRLPSEQQAQVEILFPILLARLVDRQLLSDAARTRGYSAKPEIREAVRRFEEDLIREAYVGDYLAGEIRASEVEARVKALSDGNVSADIGRRQKIREEMSRLALDRLLAQLRQQTNIQLYPSR